MNNFSVGVGTTLPDGNDPRVQALVNALVTAEDIIVRASITFRGDDGRTETFDLADNVGHRLGVVSGMLTYWSLQYEDGTGILSGGFPHNVPPSVSNTPDGLVNGQIDRMEFVITSEFFIIVDGKELIGRGNSFNNCLATVSRYYYDEFGERPL